MNLEVGPLVLICVIKTTLEVKSNPHTSSLQCFLSWPYHLEIYAETFLAHSGAVVIRVPQG